MDRNANVFKFQGSKMIVSGKGPNFSMNTSFRPNLLSSTMNMPRNFEKQSSAASVASSQRSIYHGRDTSPTASIHSDLQPRNFHQPFYSRGYSQRSAYNDRGLSPVSMRSIGSTASRADIVLDAIQSCTEDEWEKIWHAVNRKHEFRKKAQKRRKMKMKNIRNRSDDEGAQGSHSSISNDDCASTQTGYSRGYRYDPYGKENIPRRVHNYDCRSEDMYRISNRDAYSGCSRSDLRNPYQIENSAYCHANINPPQHPPPYQQQTKFDPTYFSQRNVQPHNERTLYSPKNTICGPKITLSQINTNGQSNISSIQRNTLNASICSIKSMPSMTIMSQRDRFKGGFQFPSQKFNRSTLYEEQEPVRNKQFPKKDCANKEMLHRDQIDEQSDENDNIFLDTTVNPKTVTKKSQKRKAESLDDIPNPAKKKPKTTTSYEKNKAKKQQTQNKNNNEKNEFEFVKPQFPVRKSAPAKPREKLISKSCGAPDLFCNIKDKNLKPQPAQPPSPEPDPEPEKEIPELTTSDLSMRPSFMKRKLFTQTLDVTERKNNSFDSSSADSPQNNIYSALSKEKHKTRKLITGQSLLSRDVNQDDDNLLDLIHKIVPPNQVNSTITANSKPRVSETKNNDDKWDITSIISIHNNDSVSETYTDDEIFKVDNDDSKSKPQEKPVTKKNKQDEKNKVANKPDSKKTDNITLVKNKNIKGAVDINTKNSKHVDNVNPASNKNVNHTNNDITKDIGNTKTTNTKNIKDIGDTKQTNIEICKDVVGTKLANNNVKDVGFASNTKTAKNKNVKEGVKIKVISNIIIKNADNEPNNKTSKDTSRNPLSCKNVIEGNKHSTNTRNDKDILRRVPPATSKTDTSMKPCPLRVMLSRSRVDAFWDTDESDMEGAGARRDLTTRPDRATRPDHTTRPIKHHKDLTNNHVASPNENDPDAQQTNRNPVLSPVVALQDVSKVPKKQTNKKTANKTQPKTLKKADDNLQPETNINNKKGTPNTSLRRRRQVNLSSTLNSVHSSDFQVKDKENITTMQKKQISEKKGKQDKNNKTKTSTEISKSRNKKQDMSLMDNSKERVETPKSQRHSKTTKVQTRADHGKIDLSKVLRSRIVDLSSSFNSDKFELTMSRTRKLRTPSKRISFNKSKNMLPKNNIRNRATKS